MKGSLRAANAPSSISPSKLVQVSTVGASDLGLDIDGEQHAAQWLCERLPGKHFLVNGNKTWTLKSSDLRRVLQGRAAARRRMTKLVSSKPGRWSLAWVRTRTRFHEQRGSLIVAEEGLLLLEQLLTFWDADTFSVLWELLVWAPELTLLTDTYASKMVW